MAAAKRSSGSGVVVALVIFIVLALIGIGVAVWVYQQYAIVKKAALANQASFHGKVAKVFDGRQWPLERSVGAEYGLEYGPDAFDDVAAKLHDAGAYEDMVQVLGWHSVEGVKSALEVSPVQDQATGETYSTLQGLLFWAGAALGCHKSDRKMGWFLRLLNCLSPFYKGCNKGATIKIEAICDKDGQRHKRVFELYTSDEMLATAIPPVIVSLMIVNREIEGSGVLAPGQVVPTKKFVEALKKYGLDYSDNIEPI